MRGENQRSEPGAMAVSGDSDFLLIDKALAREVLDTGDNVLDRFNRKIAWVAEGGGIGSEGQDLWLVVTRALFWREGSALVEAMGCRRWKPSIYPGELSLQSGWAPALGRREPGEIDGRFLLTITCDKTY